MGLLGQVGATSSWGIPSTSQPLLVEENLCVSIPGKRDMMMTPMDFYASITPDCNKFGVSGRVLATDSYFNENSSNTRLSGLQIKLHRQWLESMWLSPRPRWQQVGCFLFAAIDPSLFHKYISSSGVDVIVYWLIIFWMILPIWPTRLTVHLH